MSRLGKVPHFTDANEFPVGPALQAYLDRVANALGVPVERRSIRTWVFVQEDRDRYHYDAVVISIDLKTHEIRCNDPAYQPEDAEQIKITEELETSVKWPKSISTSESAVQHGLRNDIRKLRGKDPILFPFPDAKGGVCFVQERIYFEKDDDMKKIDLPWSYWNDGKWRNIEPGGELPLFGLDQLSTASMVCIHEGAKTASCVQEMVKSGKWKDHPWGEDLRLSAHLGWPGGAPNPKQVDWGPIRRLSLDVRCILVLDNDVSGINAAPEISRLLMRPLRAIRFDVRFEPHFDLADAFPKEMWKPNSKDVMIYKGPSFYDCMFPATWATEKKGKTVSLRAPFAAEWLHTVKPETFVHRDIPKYWTMAQFNSLVKPFSHSKDVACLVRDQLHGKAEKLAYNPGEKTGIITTDDGSALNVYRPSLIKAKAKAKAKTGDDKPWVEFLEHLIPEEKDRLETLRWCATLVCCPGAMRYGLLLISEVQGVGKSTLFVILTALVGPWNVSLPTEKDIVGSEFNAWKAKKRLAVIHADLLRSFEGRL